MLARLRRVPFAAQVLLALVVGIVLGLVARGMGTVDGSFVDGTLVLYLERGGKGLQVLVDDNDPRLGPAIEALTAAVERGRIRRLAVEKVNGEPVVGSAWEEPLLALGFRAGPRKLTIGA